MINKEGILFITVIVLFTAMYIAQIVAIGLLIKNSRK